MMMMMMNCFCCMVDRRKAFSLISSREHCQRSSPSQISDTLRAGFEPAQNLNSSLVKWSCAVVITTTPRRHNIVPLSPPLAQYTCKKHILSSRKHKVHAKVPKFCHPRKFNYKKYAKACMREKRSMQKLI